MHFYQYQNPPLAYSHFKDLAKERQAKFIAGLSKNKQTLVDVICFCLMPNHFHLILKQNQDKGISDFLGNIQNSYAKYFNLKRKRTGSLFQSGFKAVLIEDDDQLKHVSRYIHLNPYTSMLISKPENLNQYLWSSFSQYTGIKNGFCQCGIILDQFKSRAEYKSYVLNMADYQKKLGEIKHLIKE